MTAQGLDVSVRWFRRRDAQGFFPHWGPPFPELASSMGLNRAECVVNISRVHDGCRFPLGVRTREIAPHSLRTLVRSDAVAKPQGQWRLTLGEAGPCCRRHEAFQNSEAPNVKHVDPRGLFRTSTLRLVKS